MNSQFITAFYDVIQELFVKKNINFEIIIYDNISNRMKDVIDGILKNFLVHQIYQKFKWTFSPEVLIPAIIFCDSLDDINDFFERFHLDDERLSTPKNLKFLFYFEKPLKSKIKILGLTMGFGKIEWYSYILKHFRGELYGVYFSGLKT